LPAQIIDLDAMTFGQRLATLRKEQGLSLIHI